MSHIGEAIKAWRRRWGHTQREAADFLRVSAAFLNDIEQDRRNLSDGKVTACPFGELRAALVDARVKELEERIAWLKAQRGDNGPTCTMVLMGLEPEEANRAKS